jgi:hypothetical protein
VQSGRITANGFPAFFICAYNALPTSTTTHTRTSKHMKLCTAKTTKKTALVKTKAALL